MFGGIDPKKMQAMMKQMGIKQEQIEASRVIIEGSDKKIVIENPNVMKVTMQGQDSWQISGDAHEEGSISESDVEMVAEKANTSKEKARNALEKSGGDIASAIMDLSD